MIVAGPLSTTSTDGRDRSYNRSALTPVGSRPTSKVRDTLLTAMVPTRGRWPDR